MIRTKRNDREEGAVMFIVMLILLMGTATAIFAMHTTSYEVRAVRLQQAHDPDAEHRRVWPDRDDGVDRHGHARR